MLARILPLALAFGSLANLSCSREADAATDTARATANVTSPEHAEKLDAIAELSVDTLIVAEHQALERTRGLLAEIDDAAEARVAAQALVEVRAEVAALEARRKQLNASGAEPENRLAYAMQREVLSKTEARIALELQRLADINGVRDALENDLQPILDAFLNTSR